MVEHPLLEWAVIGSSLGHVIDWPEVIENVQRMNRTWSQGFKTFFMLSSAETEIYPAHKC